jgi:4-hydroxythreonine-4-phosphate dehydrogenase
MPRTGERRDSALPAMTSGDTSPPTLAVTIGDPAGIGPEIVLAALARGAAEGARVLLLGDVTALRRTADARDLPLPTGLRPAPAEGAAAALWALEEACRLAANGDAQAIVTAPVTKSDLAALSPGFRGQTEFLGRLLGVPRPTMMLAGDTLRVALATTHLPLREVPDAVTREAVERAVRRTHAGLVSWFGIPRPRIAVLGLNPHAGEEGLLGEEESVEIAPAIAACRADGIDCEGPLPGDGVFAPRTRHRYDAFVAAYHDQGLAALKAVDGGRAVNLSFGLPVPRTSPDHGSARGIAGRGVADPTSMEAALRLAVDALARMRRGNPSRDPARSA